MGGSVNPTGTGTGTVQGAVMDTSELALRRIAVETRPEDAEARQLLALALVKEERHKEAMVHFEEACRLCPNHSPWHYNRGLSLQVLQDYPNAVAAYREAVNGAPDLFEGWANLALVYKSLGRFSDAQEAAHRSIELRPEDPAGYRALGSALWGSGDLAGAAVAFQQARSRAPDDWGTTLNLANTLKGTGQLQEAIGLLRGVVLVQPNWPEAHRDLAQVLLLNGEFEEGWRENIWRWKTAGMEKRKWAAPEWEGEPLEGKKILLYTEQGFGDSLQFVRYAPQVAARGGRVILECQEVLKRLFDTMKSVEQVVAHGERLPTFDFQCPLMELPRIFETTLDTIPNETPYLQAEGTRTTGKCPRVGMAWKGPERTLNNRSVELQYWTGLIECPGVEWWSLQLEGTAALGNLEWGNRVRDETEEISDFADTAALMMDLDLVVTVDTSVAHLAGALGRPTWVLLAQGSDWRWLRKREDSPWYPTLRLFRQGKGESWPEVMGRVRTALQAGGF